jgi:uncharacterized protein CbrC (UPF0167 family)
VSGYWVVVAPVGVLAMGAVVVLSRRLARPRPRPRLALKAAPTFTGSMQLEEEPGRRPGRLATWFPHPDPFAAGWPQAAGWTAEHLAMLADDAPGVVTGGFRYRQYGSWAELDAAAAEQLGGRLADQLGAVDQAVPDDVLPLKLERVAVKARPLNPWAWWGSMSTADWCRSFGCPELPEAAEPARWEAMAADGDQLAQLLLEVADYQRALADQERRP